MRASKILIGVPPHDPNPTHVLLSWALNVLARPNDTITALHVIENAKRASSKAKHQKRARRAKAFAIFVVSEFAERCHEKQVNLEVKVGFSSTIGKGLIEEANLSSAEFLLLRGARNQSNKNSLRTVKYCYEHAPESCAVVSIANHTEGKRLSESKFSDSRGQSYYDEKPSPRTVLDGFDCESHCTEEEASTFEDFSSIGSSHPLPSPEINVQSITRTQKRSALKRFSSFFLYSFDFSWRKRRGEPFDGEINQSLLTCFSYGDISEATNNFHPDNLVGLGGYSEVYRGELCNGDVIAVKRLGNDNSEKEFLMELGILGHVCHPNTAKLIGFCIESGHHLIFNFCSNGNLATALHGSKISNLLDWPIRYKIAVGVARGLHYLHKCCKHRIIHRDIKSSNVLLGMDYEPQITDFGLAKWLPNKMSHHSVIPIEGTFGYLAPEYFMHGIVDEKTDVFSFGILLLEIISGRRPINSSEQNLLHWAKPLIESRDIEELADPKLGGIYDTDEMQRIAIAASYCVRRSPIWRPPMAEVVELVCCGHDSEGAMGWGMPMYVDDDCEMEDDYSMVLESDDDSTFLASEDTVI